MEKNLKDSCLFWKFSLHRNERCNTERITSLITQHISDAKLTAESEEKLVYTLPLERTDKFPGNRLCDHIEHGPWPTMTLTAFSTAPQVLLRSFYMKVSISTLPPISNVMKCVTWMREHLSFPECSPLRNSGLLSSSTLNEALTYIFPETAETFHFCLRYRLNKPYF